MIRIKGTDGVTSIYNTSKLADEPCPIPVSSSVSVKRGSHPCPFHNLLPADHRDVVCHFVRPSSRTWNLELGSSYKEEGFYTAF
ncbi:hypothetical protein EYF80_045643 [Liparis tanakae]|uniref:Uncharacterized protein n=1 Tax=Liparis tanakae TaxID=230148 RepID=A0A4Z2FTR1_9TELE|nr:hypothetical protein EYF80_045643 [Liparis tanakae]